MTMSARLMSAGEIAICPTRQSGFAKAPNHGGNERFFMREGTCASSFDVCVVLQVLPFDTSVLQLLCPHGHEGGVARPFRDARTP